MDTTPSEKDLKDWQIAFLAKDENANILSSPDENDSVKLYCSESMASSGESLQCSESMFSSASDDDLARITLLQNEASNRGFPSSASDSTVHQWKLSLDDAVQESNREAFFQSALWEHRYSDPSRFNVADNKARTRDIFDHSAISSKVGMDPGSNNYGCVTVQPVSSAGLVPNWNRESMARQRPVSFGSLGSNTDLGSTASRTLDSFNHEPKSMVPFSLNSNTQLFANSYGSYENMNLKQKGIFECCQSSAFGAVSYDSSIGERKGNGSHVHCEESSRFGQLRSASNVIESQNQIPALSSWYCKPIAASSSVDLLNSLTTGSGDSDFSISDFDQYQKASTVNVTSGVHVNPVSATAGTGNPYQFQISGQVQDIQTVNSVEEVTKMRSDVGPKVSNENYSNFGTTVGDSVATVSSLFISPCTSSSRTDSTIATSETPSLPWTTGTDALPSYRKESSSGLSRPWESMHDISRSNLNAKGTDENGNTLDSKSLQSLIDSKNELSMYSETAERIEDTIVETELLLGIALLGKSVDTLSSSSHSTAKSDLEMPGHTAVVGACDGAANTFPVNPANALLRKTAEIKLGKTADVKLAKSDHADVLDGVGLDITANVPGGMNTSKTGLRREYAAGGKIADMVPATNQPFDVFQGKTKTLVSLGAEEPFMDKACLDGAIVHGVLSPASKMIGDVEEKPCKDEPDLSTCPRETVELVVSTPSHDKLNEMVSSAGALMFQSSLDLAKAVGSGAAQFEGGDEPHNGDAVKNEESFDKASNEDAFPNVIVDQYEDVSSSSDSKRDTYPTQPAGNNPRPGVVRQLKLDPGSAKTTVNTIKNLEDFVTNFSVDEDVGSELYKVSAAEQLSSHDSPFAPKIQEQKTTVLSNERYFLGIDTFATPKHSERDLSSRCSLDQAQHTLDQNHNQVALDHHAEVGKMAALSVGEVSCGGIESGYAESQTEHNLPPIRQESSSVEGYKSPRSNPEIGSARDQTMEKPQPSQSESSSDQASKLRKLLTNQGSNSAESSKSLVSYPKNRSTERRQSKAFNQKRGSTSSRKLQLSYRENAGSTTSQTSQPYYPESNSSEGLLSSTCIVLSDESEPPVDQTWRTSQADSLELSNIRANFATCSQNPVLRKTAPVRPVPIRYSGYKPYPGFDTSCNMSAPYYPWWGSYQMNYFPQTAPLDLSLPKMRSRTRSGGIAGHRKRDSGTLTESPKKKRKSSTYHSDKKVNSCKRRVARLHSIDGIDKEHSDMTVISNKCTSNAGSKSPAKCSSNNELSAYYAKEKNSYRTSLKPPKKRRYLGGDCGDFNPVKGVAGAKNLKESPFVASSPLASADTESPSAGIWKHPKKRKYVENEDNLNLTNTPSFEVCKLENRFEGENRKSNQQDDLEGTNSKSNLMFKEPAVDEDFSYEEKRWAAMTSRFRQDVDSVSRVSTADPKKKKLSVCSSSFGEEAQETPTEGFSVSSSQDRKHMISTPIKDAKQGDDKTEVSPFGGQDLSYEESRWLAIKGRSGQVLEKSSFVAGDKWRRKQIVKQEPRGDSLCSGSSRDMLAIQSLGPGTIRSGLANFIVSSQSAINVGKMDNPALADGGSKVKYPSWCKGMVRCDLSAQAPYGGGDGGRDIDDSSVPWYRNETGDVIDALLPLLTCGICSQKMKGYFLMALHMMKIHEIHFAPQRLAGLCDICGNQYPGDGVLEKHIITVHTGLAPADAQASDKGNSVGKKKSVHHRRRKKRSWKKVKQTSKKKQHDGNNCNVELWHHIENEGSGYEMIERSDRREEILDKEGLGPVHYIDSEDSPGHLVRVKMEAKSEEDGGQCSEGRIIKEEELEEGGFEGQGHKGQVKTKGNLVEGDQGHESTGKMATKLVDRGGQGDEVDELVPWSKKKKSKKVKVEIKGIDQGRCCLEGQDSAEVEDAVTVVSKKNPKTGKGGSRKKNKYSMREVGPFACDWDGCDMILKTRETLKVHMRRHTGEKPFGCHVCDYRGRQIASLHWHLSHVHGIGDKYQSSLRGKNRTGACTPDDSNFTDGQKTKRKRRPSDDKLEECTWASRKNTGRPTDDHRHKLAAGLNSKCDFPAAGGVKVKKSRKVELDPRHPLTMKIIETERPST